MDSLMDIIFCIKKILPDLDFTDAAIHGILHSDSSKEEKIHQIILNHLKNKKLKFHTSCQAKIISTEAKEIHKLYPTAKIKHIHDQLKIFEDMPQRKEIVLRLIMEATEPQTPEVTAKRTVQYFDSVNNNEPQIKIRKLEELTLKKPSEDQPQNLSMGSHDVYIATKTSVTSTVTSGSTESREPFAANIANEYEVPDIMEHFDLPVLNVQPAPIDYTLKDDAELTPGAADSTQNNENPTKIESLESDTTEIYPLDLPSLEDDELNNSYSVDLVGPTVIKINKTRLLEEEHPLPVENDPEIEKPGPSVKVQSVIVLKTPLPEVNMAGPSTSKEPIITEKEFDLIDYVREITGAGAKTIKKHCKKLHMITNIKPHPSMLNVLIDNIFANVIDSEDSDVEALNEDVLSTGSVDDEDLLETENEPQDNIETNLPETPNENAENLLDEASANPIDNADVRLVNRLCSIFPEACPKYIRGLCQGKAMTDEVLDNLITVILNANNSYPKRPKPQPEPVGLPENQLEILKEFLPDADPDYLRMMCDKFEGNPEAVKAFINEAMENRKYPTLKEWQRRQQLSAQQRQYTTEFNVENFMKLIPDPHAFFTDPARNIKLNNEDAHYALIFMRNRYNRLPIRTIQSLYTKHRFNIKKIIDDLDRVMLNKNLWLKTLRKRMDMPNNIENIPLLQELAYYTHENEIKEYLKRKKEQEETERQNAKESGLLKTCSCCYDEEVLPRDIFCCEAGCEFCKSCVVKSSEVNFGERKLNFPCLMNCGVSFSLQTLQNALPPKLFSKIAQKKALEEIKSAGIDELEMCPFCDFATIPAEGYNIFTCLNPECMKESCRMCKEPSHIPLRCDEIEKDADVKARVFVEDKMTEALLRKCYKCGVKFFKEEGCNKMTCSCGATMCYVCGQPVKDYKHFNGNGGDRFDLCPLYSDTNILNKQNVLKAGEKAKTELGNVNLKHDPMADVDKHYKERQKKYPQGHLLVGQQFVRAERNAEAIRRRVRDEQRRRVEARYDEMFARVMDAIERVHRPELP